MFKTLSLKSKLAISASFAIIVGGLSVEFLSFYASLQRLDTEVEQRLQSASASYNQYVLDWVDSKQRALTSISPSTKMANIANHLKQVQNSGAFDNVFIAYADGSQQNANQVILAPGNDDPRKWGWYINAKKDPSRVFMDNPTVASATGANVVSLGAAANIDEREVVFGADVEIQDIIVGLEKVVLPGEGYMFISNHQGNVFTHKDVGLLNKSISLLGLDFSDIQRSSQTGKDVEVEVNGKSSLIYASAITGTPLITVIVIDRDSLIAPIYEVFWGQIALTLAIVVICTFLFNLLCRVLFRPLTNVSHALEQIAHGSGDLTQRISIDAQDEIGSLANNFNVFVESMHALVAHIRELSNQLFYQSESSHRRADKNVDEIHHQQQEITMVATAVTEMASATLEIASHADNTAQVAQTSAENTHKGHLLVMDNRKSINVLVDELQRAGDVVSELNRHSQDISTVLATIQDIAEQTNLLALNAAIEAARAGEHGRGFAVVADEVRVLSQRTHDSTQEIKATIETLQSTTVDAVGLMEKSVTLATDSADDADKASAALEEISNSVKSISDMAMQIATAAEEQTHVTNEITENTSSIKDVADELVISAQDSSKEAEEVKSLAQELSNNVSTYKL